MSWVFVGEFGSLPHLGTYNDRKTPSKEFVKQPWKMSMIKDGDCSLLLQLSRKEIHEKISSHLYIMHEKRWKSMFQ